jgi:polyhydroxyalkanoate synthesis regulator phasin
VPEEAKRELEEIKREILELRGRIEKWAMLKVADVGEMNTVYKKLGILARKLAAFNPNPEAVRLKGEVERLMRRVEELRGRQPRVATAPTPARPPIAPPPPTTPPILRPRRPATTTPTPTRSPPPVPSPTTPPPVIRPRRLGSTAVGPHQPPKPPGNPEEGGEEELPPPRRVRSLRERYGGLY